MVTAFRTITTKVEILVKNRHNHADMSITKLEFLNSKVEIKVPYLLVHTRVDGADKHEFSITTKLFNLNEVSAYKEYNIITNK